MSRDALLGMLRQGLGVEDAAVRNGVTLGVVAMMLAGVDEFEPHYRIAMRMIRERVDAAQRSAS